MNNKIKNTFRMGVIVAAGAVAMVSCSDTWGDHYGATPVTDYAGTTMQAIEENAPDFADVIKAVGFDRELSSENVYTIWAPESFNKDSVLRVAATDSAAVVDQFIKNHLTRYSVSAVPGAESTVIPLMSMKSTTMVGAETFGSSKIIVPNLSCTNGVIHVINTSIPYYYNIYERIKLSYELNPDTRSLYWFLQKNDSNEIDEDRSVSHGVDEDGNKIWVSPFYVRNNKVLNAIDAYVYSEDSDYIAIIPSTEAYKKRYEIAKSLLNLYPKLQERDSLQNYYANMFALTDLFYNRNANIKGLVSGGNGLQYDSLKSTIFSDYTWPNHLYYSKAPAKGLHPDMDVNDILAKSGDPISCSNGIVYEVDEYPMSVTEQFFKKLEIVAHQGVLENSSTLFTNNVNVSSSVYKEGTMKDYAVDTIWIDEDKTEYELDSTYIGERKYHFYDVMTSGSQNPIVSFKVSNTLSGTYELYLVTCPIWAKYGFDGHSLSEDTRKYSVQVKVVEKNENNKYPESQSVMNNIPFLTPPAGVESNGNYFITDNTNKIDTLYLGDYTFKYSYYGAKEEGALILLNMSGGTNYSREILVSGFILRPKYEATDESVATEAKRK